MNDTAVKRALQQITDEPNMKVLRYVADILIHNWQKGSVIGPNEWETVKSAIAKEERKRGLEIYLEELEKMAHTE